MTVKQQVSYVKFETGSASYGVSGVKNTEHLYDVIEQFLSLDETLDDVLMEKYFAELLVLNKKFMGGLEKNATS